MGFWWTATKGHHGILADSYPLHHESPTDSYTDIPWDSHQTAAPSDRGCTGTRWVSSRQLHRETVGFQQTATQITMGFQQTATKVHSEIPEDSYDHGIPADNFTGTAWDFNTQLPATQVHHEIPAESYTGTRWDSSWYIFICTWNQRNILANNTERLKHNAVYVYSQIRKEIEERVNDK